MISGDVTVARLLDEHPELVEVLAGYHPHFGQLRNPLLRGVMAPRVTVAEAAGMAGVPVDELLAVLRQAVGEASPEAPHPGPPHPAVSPEARGGTAPFEGEGRGEGGPPRALVDVPEARQVHVDVREDIRLGREPFPRIMAAVKALNADQALVLRAPFEPIPLYDVLAKRGFAHWTERRADDDWSVAFYRAAAAPRAEPAAPPAPAPRGRTVLDVRGLEPPQPMVRVLEAIDRLEPGSELEVRHERRPMFLYPQLDERGFVHQTDEPEPGLVRILIRRGPA
ncbi:MAG TPA: DUF2249 domain-containing protein [Methylomirabilota bacterium]|nr:DUF2249 domain-containing protein [Methylomirabilota bacterium]